MKCCICHRDSVAGHLVGGGAIGVDGPVHPSCEARVRKARKRRLKAVEKVARRRPRGETARHRTVHLRARVRPFIACGPDGARRVDQDHAITMDPLLVNCPGCKATPAYSAALAAAQGV